MSDGLFAATAIVQLLTSIFDLGKFDRLPQDIQSKLTSMANKLASDWAEKQQQADYTGNSVVSSIPNRSQLESMLYKDNANETHKFMRDLEVARQKDTDYYNKNKAWFGLGKVFGTAIDTSNNLFNTFLKGTAGNIAGAFGKKQETNDWIDSIKPKSFNDWLDREATKNVRAQQTKWKDVQQAQQNRSDKFSQYVGQSHDRFKK